MACESEGLGVRRRGEEQLAYLAYHDSLTGLPNRILVEQELDLALARARRASGAAALMFVDLDDFKEVNDRLGHAAGDRLLAGVATRLRGVLRDSDVLARFRDKAEKAGIDVPIVPGLVPTTGIKGINRMAAAAGYVAKFGKLASSQVCVLSRS